MSRPFVWLLAMAVSQSAVTPQPPTRAPQSQQVRIDLIASDSRGRVLENLKAADFELRDDGVAQTLESVRFVRPAAGEGRLLAIFLDEYHVSRDAAPRVRDAMARFLREAVKPGDLITVMKPLDSLFEIKLTADRDAALEAVGRFEGRRGDYDARNAYERNFMAGVPARIEAARTQVVLSALNALAVHFAGHQGLRKTLIVVSEGMGRVDRRRGLEYMPTVETIIRSAQQGNVSIYGVNPGDDDAPGDGNAIRTLAAETAGQTILMDLDAGLRRALDDASAYYVLTYSASRPDDGRFHAVQVAVKRQGVQVLRARKGYYAPSPDETLRAVLLARLNEPKPVVPAEPAPHASPLIRPWFGTSRGSDGRTRVTFVWEPAVRATGERNRRMPARLVLTALAPDNSVLFEGVVLPTGPGQLETADAPPRSRAVFEMTPGRVRLRMAIKDAAEELLDTDVRSLPIRDLRAGVSIATPEVMRARNAREFKTLESELAVPVAAREFSRTERLLVRFAAYGSAKDPKVTVSARLMSRMGPMRDLTIEESDGVNEIDLPLAGLAAGEYIIELTATSSAGNTKDVIDFRVTA